MRSFSIRVLRVLLGLALTAAGIVASIQANVGLAPWEAFHWGFARVTGISFGNIQIIAGALLMVVALLLKEKMGLGTILNIILVGMLTDLILSFNILPQMQTFAGGILMMLAGQLLIALGGYYYISAGLGAGPRDSLMIALKRYLPKVPVGAVRGAIEGTALLIGWLLGAKVGLGTVLGAFGISFLIQLVFHLFRFDVGSLTHESLTDTWRQLLNGCRKRKLRAPAPQK